MIQIRILLLLLARIKMNSNLRMKTHTEAVFFQKGKVKLWFSPPGGVRTSTTPFDLKARVVGGLDDAVRLDGVDLELLRVAHHHRLGQLHGVTQAEHIKI